MVASVFTLGRRGESDDWDARGLSVTSVSRSYDVFFTSDNLERQNVYSWFSVLRLRLQQVIMRS